MREKKRPFLGRLGVALLGLLMLVSGAYVFGAIYFDGPLGTPASAGNIVLAILWAVLLLAALVLFRGLKRRLLVFAFASALVLVPWSFKKPSNDRDWRPEFRQTGWVEVKGDEIVFHNIRNFDYAEDGSEIERWETRTHHLSKLEGLDYFHDAFGGDLLAHPILSFDFGDEGHLCLSIETRRETTEEFSTFGGLFKMFELQYIFGTEEDFIRVRTNVRNEPVYLYRTRATQAKAAEVLLESIGVQNELVEKPRFYNVITSNCTTSLRAQTPAEEREKFDWRMLVNGRLDEYVHEKGAIVDEGMSFEELRPLCFINEVAQKSPGGPEYSAAVRADRPGFREPAPSSR
ncbi:conserved hypothetical protein [Haloferula helveola]|uniref:Lnb N-terminal periplasmic domain-containing protein n=1 Tax=Haloferula helveola TaxID=490095 RepID=A0ABN6H7T6_9BACT|nr:conserved hypothetical protein [Haloferula helveola]